MPMPTVAVASAPEKVEDAHVADVEGQGVANNGAERGDGKVDVQAADEDAHVADVEGQGAANTGAERGDGKADVQAVGEDKPGDEEDAHAADVEGQGAASTRAERGDGRADVQAVDEDAHVADVEKRGAAKTGAEQSQGKADVQAADEDQPGDDEVAQRAGPRKLSQRKALQARAAEELKQGSSEEAFARLRARLADDDVHIKEKEGCETVAIGRFEEVNREREAAALEASTAAQAELEACRALRATEKRQRDAAAKTAALKEELEKRRDVLVLLEMKHAKRRADEQEVAAKRRKIEELEQVLAESKRAAEEIRQREQEARDAMKKLMKEERQLQLKRLGGFAQRCRQKMLTCGGECPDEAATATAASVSGAAAAGVDRAAAAPQAGEMGVAAAGAEQESAPVRVKREIVQMPSPPEDQDVPVMTIVIEDDRSDDAKPGQKRGRLTRAIWARLRDATA
eukprot:CAMPEP_0171235320 /NCGR_PEP_ID=MMETSP0790-20130122/41884_1 /TAXON_ID=2925 /ORGANISM="Alexandrium catenella, Strain OF101" /LENGTH=457 /DNA_ID=CAMNT_0011701625 /DNA_START=14 /DNA_END=1388 /DNA_ORIENTATION=-